MFLSVALTRRRRGAVQTAETRSRLPPHQTSSSYDYAVMRGQGADVSLTLCSDSVSGQGHTHRYWGVGLRCQHFSGARFNPPQQGTAGPGEVPGRQLRNAESLKDMDSELRQVPREHAGGPQLQPTSDRGCVRP